MLPKLLTDVISFKQLLLTLYNQNRTTATGYSKVSRGLRFPLEIPGLCTRKECSGDSNLGQWRSRYTIHAGRHSNGKAFRSRLLLSLRIGTDHFHGECTFLYTSSNRLEGRTISSLTIVRSGLSCRKVSSLFTECLAYSL